MSESARKQQYYVWYLGWKEASGLWGREFTEPLVKELIARRKDDILPKLTIEVTKRELRIIQLVEKKKGKIDKVKYPSIPCKDITYVAQALAPDEDVVACIYLGFNPYTNKTVHVHVYRCDTPETAEYFTDHLTAITQIPEHQQRITHIERQLVVRGELQPRSSHNVAALSEGSTRTPSSEDGLSIQSGPQDDEAPPAYEPPARRQSPDNKFFAASGVDAINEAVRQGAAQRLRKAPSTSQNAAGAEMDISDEVYKSLAEELKHKLGNKKDSPLLLPPKDYDTLHRQHGKTGAYAAATNPDLVGQRGSYAEEAVIETSNDSSTGNLRLNIYNKSQDYSHWTPKSRQTDNEAQNITRVDPRLSNQAYLGATPISSNFTSSAENRPTSPYMFAGSSYFPPENSLPGNNYHRKRQLCHVLTSTGYLKDSSPASPITANESYDLYGGSQSGHEKKYSASSLGLTNRYPDYTDTGRYGQHMPSPSVLKDRSDQDPRRMYGSTTLDEWRRERREDEPDQLPEPPIDYTIHPMRASSKSRNLPPHFS